LSRSSHDADLIIVTNKETISRATTDPTTTATGDDPRRPPHAVRPYAAEGSVCLVTLNHAGLMIDDAVGRTPDSNK
jgi:hypothetical protein